jgi:dodecin
LQLSKDLASTQAKPEANDGAVVCASHTSDSEELNVTDHVYSVSEIVGSAPGSIDDAIRNALDRARKTLRHLDWFEVTEIRGHLKDDGSIDYFQVGLKVGFRLER